MDHAWSSSVQPTSHISFWISSKLCKWLAIAEIWPPNSFGSPVVKFMLCGGKKVNFFLLFLMFKL